MLFKTEYNFMVLRSLLGALAALVLVFALPDAVFAAAEKIPLMEKSGILSLLYGAIMVISLLLTVGYFILVRKKDIWFLLLFTSVLIVNAGYFLLSVSGTLSEALWANRLSYFGSVFLPFFMLMILMNVCHVPCKKWVRIGLILLGFAIFLLAASGGVLPCYYESVSLGHVDGISVLEKVYGPLHPVYLVYLLSYFAAMITVIVQSAVAKKIASQKYAVILVCLVLCNIGVWFFEQNFRLEFEFLSISYILTELFLLFISYMLQDYELRRDGSLDIAASENTIAAEEDLFSDPNAVWQLIESSPLAAELTGREKEVLQLILEHKKRKDIAEILHVSENTVKKHTSHIYTKLDVTCRKELFEKIKP